MELTLVGFVHISAGKEVRA